MADHNAELPSLDVYLEHYFPLPDDYKPVEELIRVEQDEFDMAFDELQMYLGRLLRPEPNGTEGLAKQLYVIPRAGGRRVLLLGEVANPTGEGLTVVITNEEGINAEGRRTVRCGDFVVDSTRRSIAYRASELTSPTGSQGFKLTPESGPLIQQIMQNGREVVRIIRGIKSNSPLPQPDADDAISLMMQRRRTFQLNGLLIPALSGSCREQEMPVIGKLFSPNKRGA